jgi:tetratricopeptide (TPR) repeat protein
MLDEVEPRLRRVLPEGHYAFGALISQRSRVAQLRGDLPGALRLADEALAIDEAAGDSGSSNLAQALVQRAELRLELRQPDLAVDDASRALAMLEETASAGMHTITLGRAYLALARALRGKGDREGGYAMLASAIEHLEDAAGPDHPETLEAQALLQEQATTP